MFYAHFVLSKKGPLARIWLAAHWDKKLTKAHVFETNIDSSVEAIIQPKVKMALRTSGHLLLGVVRIYSRKAKYLLADCNEAFVKIKMAFRPGVVDLPEESREAAAATITLPETFHDFDTTMADLSDIDVQAQFSVNQSRPEEITMREDFGNITLVGDDGFGDMGFDDRTLMQDDQMDESLYKNPDSSNILLDDTVTKDTSGEGKAMDIDFDAPPRDDGFGEGLDDFAKASLMSKEDNFGIAEGGGLFEEPPVPEVQPIVQEEQIQDKPVMPEQVPHEMPEQDTTHLPQEQSTAVPDQTTLLPNEAEAFALEPLDVTSMSTERKVKRKRKLIVDDQKGIASETMKLQLSDTSEIITTLDLAPPTKKLMHWKETGGVEKLFALPGLHVPSKRIGRFFTRNLITKPIIDEDLEEDKLDLDGERAREEEAEISVRPERPSISMSVAEDTSRLEQDSTLHAPVETSSISQPPEESFIQPPAPPIQPEISFEQTLQPEPEPEPEPVPELLPPPLEQQPSPDIEDADDLFGSADLPEDAPPSVEPPEEEQQEGENDEDFEERIWNKRTQHLMHIIGRTMDAVDSHNIGFHGLVTRNNRKQVASKFYTLLVLKKQQAIDVVQNSPYGDIEISRGAKFQEVF